MFDVSDMLDRFYKDSVRPDGEALQGLATHRDATLERLERGLAKLREEGKKAGPYASTLNQGSYAMDTIILQPNDDYDLDIAVIFDADQIPESALDARKRVHEALMLDAANFSKEPEVRNNAVTVWYAAGHHVDLAVYRRRKDWWDGEVIEHASTDWKPRVPGAVQEWFSKALSAKEPGGLFEPLKVEPKQLRRVVRFVKAFARSRPSWSLPGGMILTTLVVEVFDGDASRDDVALYKTLRALHQRLQSNVEVTSPIDSSAKLTAKPKFQTQVERLRDRLAEVLPALEVLNSAKCTRGEALRAWGKIFWHPTWTSEAKEEAEDVRTLDVEISVARKQGGRTFRRYIWTGPVLQKDLWLRFRLSDPGKYSGCRVRWTVKNSGDESDAEKDYGHEAWTAPDEPRWEWCAYKGTHSMTCEVLQDGKVIATAVRKIRIGSR